MDSGGLHFHPARVHSRALPHQGATTRPTEPPGLLHQLFEQQAAQTPDAPALVCEKRTTSFGELDRAANQLARFLREQGIGPGSCVALLLRRSEELYLAMLAVLKSGAAYVPLEPDYPNERIRLILEDCAATLLLTGESETRTTLVDWRCFPLAPSEGERAGLPRRSGSAAKAGVRGPSRSLSHGPLRTSDSLAHKGEGFSGKTLSLDACRDAIANCSEASLVPVETGVTSRDLCYVIYTSGTTGRPKGVQIEHRSAVHLVQTEAQLFQVNPADRVFQGFSVAFDASIEEIWLSFFAGATLVVGTEQILHSGPALSRFLIEEGVTVLSCVPTLLSMLEEDVPCLRLLILGGEVCPPELVKRWWRPNRRVVNTYGPTEATVIATCADCDPDRPITIGRPLPGYSAFVLNEHLDLAGPGEAGELVLGGVGLARGYLGQPELTREKFIFRSLNSGPPERLYRTGDCARWTQNGDLEFLGRLDTQVKIRGFRVELSEIEAALLESPEVKAAAAVLKNDSTGMAQLVAYLVPSSKTPPDPQVLRLRLRARLPAYMVPALFEVIPALPMLSSGKVDRNALPAPAALSAQAECEAAHLDTSTVSQIVRAWTKLFDSANISIHDDFFLDLGGHSLLAARMVSELRRSQTFAGLSMADVYRYPTPKILAEALESRSAPLSNHVSAAGKPEQPRSPEPARLIPFWRHFFCGAAQLLSLVFVLSFFALQWLAPYLTYTVLIEEEYDFVVSVLAAFASLVLLYPFMVILAIALKWIIIGRYKPGRHPLWGWYYFRFWLVTSIEATVPVSYLAGTPLLSLYLRLMGARVGRNVFIHSDNFAVYDLLSLGDDSSINADASLLGYSVSDGFLNIGTITVGSRCFVGARTVICENSSMADDSALEDLSLLLPGQKIGPGETWIGSPARLRTDDETKQLEAAEKPGFSGQRPGPAEIAVSTAMGAPPSRRFAFALLHGIGLLIFPILVVAALFPGIALMNHLNYLDPYYWYLFLSPLVAVSFVAFLCLEIAALKWLFLGRIRPGVHRIESWYYVRKWFVDKTIELSLDVVGPLYASVYLAPWYKLLGAKFGRGAEVSTASFISPDLLTIGEESFIADNVSLGAPRVRGGTIKVDHNQIGRRAFIGNSALLPPGTVIGDSVLVGCLSVPPVCPADALRQDTGWLGSPALLLKQRLKNESFGEAATFNPSARLRALRAAIEFVRIITPSTCFIILTSLLFSGLLLLHDWLSLGQTLLFFPVFYLGCGLSATLFTILIKWVLVGRYRPGEKPLWSTFVWRNELVNALHEHLASPFLVGLLTGTPFVAWYLRLMGARIGRRVYLETIDFSEFDLARIGDEAALNSDCTVQTHLFEDRVMKMSRVDIGSGCSVGAGSLVLYDTHMEPGSKLGPLSLLMKSESLPSGTSWAGSPARLLRSPEQGRHLWIDDISPSPLPKGRGQACRAEAARPRRRG